MVLYVLEQTICTYVLYLDYVTTLSQLYAKCLKLQVHLIPLFVLCCMIDIHVCINK